MPLTCPFCTSLDVELTPRHSHSAAICECRSCRTPFFVPIERDAMRRYEARPFHSILPAA